MSAGGFGVHALRYRTACSDQDHCDADCALAHTRRQEVAFQPRVHRRFGTPLRWLPGSDCQH
eukprot:328154-Prymnesium_polylepis.1